MIQHNRLAQTKPREGKPKHDLAVPDAAMPLHDTRGDVSPDLTLPISIYPPNTRNTCQLVSDTDTQGNEVYDGSSNSAGIFLHRSSNNAIVKGVELTG